MSNQQIVGFRKNRDGKTHPITRKVKRKSRSIHIKRTKVFKTIAPKTPLKHKLLRLGKYKVLFVDKKIYGSYVGMHGLAAKALGHVWSHDEWTIEVWNGQSEKDKQLTIEHEIRENRLMRQGMKYHDAHAQVLAVMDDLFDIRNATKNVKAKVRNIRFHQTPFKQSGKPITKDNPTIIESAVPKGAKVRSIRTLRRLKREEMNEKEYFVLGKVMDQGASYARLGTGWQRSDKPLISLLAALNGKNMRTEGSCAGHDLPIVMQITFSRYSANKKISREQFRSIVESLGCRYLRNGKIVGLNTVAERDRFIKKAAVKVRKLKPLPEDY